MSKRATRSQPPSSTAQPAGAAALAGQLVPQVVTVRHAGDPNDPIDTQVAIDINDVVAIASTRAADFLEEQRSQAEKDVTDCRRQLTATETAIRETLLAAGKRLYRIKAMRVARVMGSFLDMPYYAKIVVSSLNLSPITAADAGGDDDEGDAGDGDEAAAADAAGYVLVTVMPVPLTGCTHPAPGAYRGHVLEISRPVPWTSLGGLADKWRTDRQSLEQAEARLLQIRAGIAKLPLLEKRWRSDLAESKLRNSDTGRQIVEQLIASVPERVLKLTQQK